MAPPLFPFASTSAPSLIFRLRTQLPTVFTSFPLRTFTTFSHRHLPSAMADPNLEDVLNYAGDEFAIIREGLRLGYNEDDEQVVARLVAAWKAERATRIEAWNARLGAEVEQQRRQQGELEEEAERDEAERTRLDAGKKKLKMNSFVPGSSAPDVLSLPPSQYALQS